MLVVILIGTAHIGIVSHVRYEATPQAPTAHLRTKAPPRVASMSVSMERAEIER
jgi:hypothetical protein